jgi:putative GTP pyrophosphokinase
MPDSDDYVAATAGLNEFGQNLQNLIERLLERQSIKVNQVTYRVKSRESANSKVRDNPDKYSSISDLTDLLGVRIITYFPSQVDAVGEIMTREFDIDYSRSTDKRAALDADRFGYLSVHYLARLNEMRATLGEYSQFAGIYAEFQVRSLLQHAWAEIEHDLGYKSEAAVPRDVRRRFSRLAGLLEIADTEFQAIHDERTTYTTRVSAQLKIGAGNLLLDQISLVTYIENNTMIHGLDEKLALIFRTRLAAEPDVSIYYAANLASSLASLGIETIEELNAALLARTDSVIDFAREWAKRSAGQSEAEREAEFTHGVSLFYLSIIMAIEKFGDIDAEFEAWIDSSPFDSPPPQLASEFRDAYNRAELP